LLVSHPPTPYSGRMMSESATHRPDTVHRALREMASDGVRIRLDGDCMTPDLVSDEEYTVRRHRFYWPGDVLLFQARDGTLTTHRLLGAYPRAGRWKLLTQADAAQRPDFAVPTDQVIGRVEEAQPRRLFALGRFLRFCLRR
jgi:hypothetical protein